MFALPICFCLFFFNDTATTEIYTLSLHDALPISIDEDLLKEIAANTGGKYFRATDNRSLEDIYDEIDKMEKSKIEVKEYRKKTERFFPYALLAAALLILELLLRNTIFRSIP